MHLSRLYDGVPKGLLRLLLSGVPHGYFVPEKSALGDTTEAPRLKAPCESVGSSCYSLIAYSNRVFSPADGMKYCHVQSTP